jgi:hypothetical protein
MGHLNFVPQKPPNNMLQEVPSPSLHFVHFTSFQFVHSLHFHFLLHFIYFLSKPRSIPSTQRHTCYCFFDCVSTTIFNFVYHSQSFINLTYYCNLSSSLWVALTHNLCWNSVRISVFLVRRTKQCYVLHKWELIEVDDVCSYANFGTSKSIRRAVNIVTEYIYFDTHIFAYTYTNHIFCGANNNNRIDKQYGRVHDNNGENGSAGSTESLLIFTAAASRPRCMCSWGVCPQSTPTSAHTSWRPRHVPCWRTCSMSLDKHRRCRWPAARSRNVGVIICLRVMIETTSRRM